MAHLSQETVGWSGSWGRILLWYADNASFVCRTLGDATTKTLTSISLTLDSATLDRLAERERETGQTQAQLAE